MSFFWGNLKIKPDISYRYNFQQGVTEDDIEHKATLEEQCKFASQNVFKKQKELQKLKKDYDEDLNRYTELNNKYEILAGQKNQYQVLIEKSQKELQDQNEKIQRAKKTLSTKMNSLKSQKINLNEDNPHMVQMRYDIENNRNKTILSALTYMNP